MSSPGDDHAEMNRLAGLTADLPTDEEVVAGPFPVTTQIRVDGAVIAEFEMPANEARELGLTDLKGVSLDPGRSDLDKSRSYRVRDRLRDRVKHGEASRLRRSLVDSGWSLGIVDPDDWDQSPWWAYPPSAGTADTPRVLLPARVTSERQMANLVVVLRRLGSFEWET